QAEDGIRARNVTGVQTCALPISVLISWFGGFDMGLGPLRLRSRDAARPAALSALAFIFFLVIDHRRARRALAAAWTVVDSRRASDRKGVVSGKSVEVRGSRSQSM